MARFTYLGEPDRPGLVEDYGPTLQIKIPKKDGTLQVVTAADQVNGFELDVDIGADITDVHALHIMRIDTRFEEI